MEGRPRARDDRPLLLFDLNGVLVYKDKQAAAGAGGGGGGGRYNALLHVRPQLQALLALAGPFRLGIYSSAMHSTVQRALREVGRHMAAADNGGGGSANGGANGGGGRDPERLFEVIFHRSHCEPDPHWERRPGGQPHHTVKPLQRQGLDVTRTVLVDNEDFKAAAGEEGNMLVVGTWQDAPGERARWGWLAGRAHATADALCCGGSCGAAAVRRRATPSAKPAACCCGLANLVAVATVAFQPGGWLASAALAFAKLFQR